MKVGRIKELLNAVVLAGEEQMDLEVKAGCGCDLMSDVLAFPKEHMVLLTGLTNLHTVRTADMLDVSCVVFVRGKRPMPDVIEMASDRGIVIMATDHTLYTACGILYAKGLPGNVGSEL